MCTCFQAVSCVMEAAASPSAVSDSGTLCPEIVGAVLHFARIARMMESNDLVDCADLLKSIARVADNPRMMSAALMCCRGYLKIRLVGKVRKPFGRQVLTLCPSKFICSCRLVVQMQ